MYPDTDYMIIPGLKGSKYFGFWEFNYCTKFVRKWQSGYM